VVRPSVFAPSLAELAASLVRLSQRAGAGLAQLEGMDPQSAAVLTTGVARCGRLMLVGWRGWGRGDVGVVGGAHTGVCAESALLAALWAADRWQLAS
jgi:hypothetical protein